MQRSTSHARAPWGTPTPYCVALCAALALTGRASSAHAQTAASSSPTPASEAEARAHFDRGVTLFGNRDFDGALAEFLAAYEIGGRPIVLFNIAATQRELHHYREAARATEQYLQVADLPHDRREALEAALAELQGFIGHITIVGAVPGTRLRVDGEVISADELARPVEVSTGRHEIEATAPGYEAFRANVVVAGGQSRDVTLEMHANGAAPIAAPRASTLRVYASVPGAVIDVDGTAAPLDRADDVAPGVHTVHARAPNFAPVERTIQIAQGANVSLTAHLERASASLAPVIVGVAVTAAFGIATAAVGAATLDTYNQFHALTQSDPRAATLSSQGSTEEIATNVLLATTLVAAAATVFIAWRSRVHGVSTIELAGVRDAMGLRF